MGFSNEKLDTVYLQEMGLVYCPAHVWYRKLQSTPYVYRVRFRDYCEIDYVDAQIIEYAKSNSNFYILLDDTLEAYVYHNFKFITKFILDNELQGKVIYMSAHMGVQAEYDAWRLHNKADNVIKIIYFNAWLSSTRRNFHDNKLDFSTKKTQWYCCLNHRPHYHRLLTIIYLDKLNLIDQGIVTGHDKKYERGVDPQNTYNTYENYIEYALKKLDSHYSNIVLSQKDITYGKLPLIHDITDVTQACQPYLMSSSIFNETLINLVTETFYFNHWNYTSEFFITEKTMKSILAKQVFIIIGPKGALSILRDMGFTTFGDYFDESYDTEPDGTRLFKAVDSLNYAMNKYTLDELDKLTSSIREKNLKVYNEINFNINLCNTILK